MAHDVQHSTAKLRNNTAPIESPSNYQNYKITYTEKQMPPTLEVLFYGKGLRTQAEQDIVDAIQAIVATVVQFERQPLVNDNGYCSIRLGKDPFCDFNIRDGNRKFVKFHEPENGEVVIKGTPKTLQCDYENIDDIINVLNKNESLIREIVKRHIAKHCP